MKAFKYIFIISAIFGLTGCTAEDESLIGLEAPCDEWTECTLTMNSDAPRFDQATTRAESVDWPNSARVYISFNKADGSTTYGSAVYDALAESWTLSYNGRLDAVTPMECQVYYFEGGNVSDNAIHTVVVPSTATAVYGATGSYNYKDGNVNLNVTLAPLTSRIRFKRSTTTGNISGSMRNVRTVSSFDLTTCNFVMTGPMDKVTVSFKSEELYSDYIYAVHDFKGFTELAELKNEVRVSDGKYVYSYELPQNSNFLKIGESGYMNWPTPDHHNGWYSYDYQTSNTIFSIYSYQNSSSSSDEKNVNVNKFDVIRTTIRPNSFFPSSSYTNSASFKLTIGDDTVLDLKATTPYPGIISGYDRLIYYVVPSNQTVHVAWAASYWSSSSSYNFVDRIVF